MNSLLYFVGGRNGMSVGDLAQHSLSHITEASISSASLTTKGPGGEPGVLFAATGVRPERMAYQASSQTWLRMGDDGPWVGFWNDGKPGASDLIRKKPIKGSFVVLEDGGQWLVPMCCWPTKHHFTWLPRSMHFNGTNFEAGDVKAQFAGVFARACAVCDDFLQLEGEQTLIAADGDLLAVDALAVNYRVTPWEVSLLGLFDSSSEQRIIKALLGLTLVEQIEKKTESDEQSSGAGSKG